MFFQLSSWALGLLLFAVALGATGIGLLVGRHLRGRSDIVREPFAALQAALLGVVGLILAFGLALAVGRYESRRAAVVQEANAIGTTYLRAQTLAGAVPDWFARMVGALHRRQHPAVALRAEQLIGGRGRRRRAGAAAGAVGARRRSARFRPHHERAAALRRHPQRDDRHADGSRFRAEQPCASCGPVAGARRRRGRPRVARGLPRPCSRLGSSRSCFS